MRAIVWLVRLRGSPEAIARGAAVGLLVAFTPTLGFQIVISLGLATLVGGSRAVAVVPTFITNPLTAAPIYAFTYWLGRMFWRAAPADEGIESSIGATTRQLAESEPFAPEAAHEGFLALGLDVFVCLWIGGLLVGGLAAGLGYPATRTAVRRLRARRLRRRLRRRRDGPA